MMDKPMFSLDGVLLPRNGRDFSLLIEKLKALHFLYHSDSQNLFCRNVKWACTSVTYFTKTQYAFKVFQF